METNLKDYDFYKLVCKTDETIYYIGSTSNMKERIRKHKVSTNKPNDIFYNTKTYNIIRANGGFDNFKFINLGNIKNVTKKEARHTEQAFINLFKPNMNTRNSYLTEEERKEQMKNYNETNKEKLKEYREENKEKNSTKAKEKYNKNKEEINEKYNKNKEEISEKNKEKFTCKCGCILRKSDLTRHKRTKKHINLMKNNESQILN